MAKRSEKYPGVYIVEGKKKTSYGIDYINPQTGQRIQKILKNVTSEKQAFELRAIELADAKRGAINKAYDIKAKGKSPLFTDMVDLYLKWSRDNKKSCTSSIFANSTNYLRPNNSCFAPFIRYNVLIFFILSNEPHA